MSGNFAIKGGGGGRLMANAILNFHFDFLNPSLTNDSSLNQHCNIMLIVDCLFVTCVFEFAKFAKLILL